MTQRVEGGPYVLNAVESLVEEVELLSVSVEALRDELRDELRDGMAKMLANQARLESALKAHGVGAWAGLA